MVLLNVTRSGLPLDVEKISVAVADALFPNSENKTERIAEMREAFENEIIVMKLVESSVV
jgi:hypothetical protein